MAGISAGTVYVDVRANTSTLGTDIQSKSKGLMSSFGAKMGGVIAGAFATKAILDFGADLIHSAETAAAANRKSLALISGDADAAVVHFDGLTQWAEDFGNSIGKDDEAITNLAAKITQSFDLKKLFGAKGAQAGLEQITQSIVDMSAATERPQKMLTKLFQTIANDPAAALTTLLKLGAITQEQADHFQKMIDNGKGAAVSTALLDTVSKKYQGSAVAGSTASERLSAVWDNLKETLGNFLLPMFEKLVGWVSQGIAWFSKAIHSGGLLSRVFEGVAKALAPLWPALKAVWEALKRVWNIVKPVLAVFIGIQVVVLRVALKVIPPFLKAAAGVITVLSEIVDWVAKAVTWLGTKLVGAFKAVGKVGKSIWDGVLGAVKVFWNAFAGLWNATIGKIGVHFNYGPIHINFDVPDLPSLEMGGTVLSTGMALVHEGETFSGVGKPNSWMPRTIEIVDSNLGLVMTGVVREDHDFDGRMARMRR